MPAMNTAKRSSRARSSFLDIPNLPNRTRVLSDHSAMKVMTANSPEQLEPLQNMPAEDLRVIVLELMKEKHVLEVKLDQQDEVVGDLYEQISELEAQNESVGQNLRKDQRRVYTCTGAVGQGSIYYYRS